MPAPVPPIPQGSRVRIRMYRQGLGDCFLLTFYGDRTPRQVLIDCGVFNGAPHGKAKIRQVAASIAAETDGKLDALVVTHEHWDHVSGFYDAKDILGPLEAGEIWLAWTENPDHPVAREMKRQNRLKLQAIHLALAQLAKTDDRHFQAYGQGISELLGFFGGPSPGATLAAFSEKTAEAMAAVTGRTPSPTYWQPGDLIVRSWLPGVRLYVLGPPLDPATLRQREGKAGTDTYALTGADSAFFTALEVALGDEADLPETERLERLAATPPFHPSLQWRDKSRVLKDPILGPLYRAYTAKNAAWQRIDHDWLLSAARLGLQLDSATNNTSLVLALELLDTGDIVLFTGDAQIASWKSWMALEWPLGDGSGTVAAADLLRRTVFYKVGHHGSHNATRKTNGLELMTSPKLVAAIPTDQIFASGKKWQMPAPPLRRRLGELTRGRLLFADGSPALLPPSQTLSAAQWQRFQASIYSDPQGLYIDYFL